MICTGKLTGKLATNIDDLERHWTLKIWRFSEFLATLGCDAHLEWIFAEITGNRPRQPAYEIKLTLPRVSWALAQISCHFCSSFHAPTVSGSRTLPAVRFYCKRLPPSGDCKISFTSPNNRKFLGDLRSLEWLNQPINVHLTGAAEGPNSPCHGRNG